MSSSRNYILDRIKSRKTSIEEFDFDSMQAPPLALFFTPYDISYLHSLATSARLASKLELKRKMMHEFLTSKGLQKCGSGTNRLVYYHPNFPDYVFKIALDDEGLKDGPAEFRNQYVLKPFVTKIFEVSPCGTIAITERVKPITSREEYLSVAEDIFELINEWLIGEYALADFGSKFFMNFGYRESFGIVILDYPYCYPIDGAKLFCSKRDINSVSGTCDGVIDYDEGYNFLKCTKCGAIYKAIDLAKKIKDKEIILEKEGQINMEFIRNGGSNNFINNKIETNRPSEILNREVTHIEQPKVTTSRPTRSVDFSTANIGNGDKTNSIKLDEELKSSRNISSRTVEPAVNVEATPVVNGVEVEEHHEEPKSSIRPMVSFSDEVKEEAIAEAKPVEEVSPVRVIENSVDNILDAVEKIDIDNVKNGAIIGAISKLVNLLPAKEAFILATNILNSSYDNLEDSEYFEAVTNDNTLLNLTDRIFDDEITIENPEREGNDLIVDYTIRKGYAADDDKKYSGSNLIGSKILTGIFESVEESTPVYPVETSNEEIPDVESIVNDTTDKAETPEAESEEEDDTSYEGMKWYNAKIVNVKHIIPQQQPGDILVILDEDGNFVTKDKKIIAVDVIDNKPLSATEFVSKAWLEGVLASADNKDDAEEALETLGMTVEEFIQAENAVENNTEE